MTDLNKPVDFTLAKAQALVDEAIKVKGEDFVYKRGMNVDCLYVHTNMVWDAQEDDYAKDDSGKTPGCIWGHALLSLGIDPKEFEPYEGSDIRQLTDAFEGDQLGEVDYLAQAWAFAVQNRQDAGDTWGDARTYANGLLERAREYSRDEEVQARYIISQL